MTTDQVLIQFLKDNKELLMDKDFQTLYDKLPAGMHPNLTKFLYNAKIDPLDYNLWHIPAMFAFTLNTHNASNFPNNLIVLEFYGNEMKMDEFPLAPKEMVRDDWMVVG